jgi:hypothetical protein
MFCSKGQYSTVEEAPLQGEVRAIFTTYFLPHTLEHLLSFTFHIYTQAKRQEQAKAFEFDPNFSDSPIEVPVSRIDEFNEYNGHLRWLTLPPSVISTMIYFVMVEHNHTNLNWCDLFKALILIGFPTYMVYVIQIIMLIGLYEAIYGNEMAAIADSICEMPSRMLAAAITVYWMSMVRIIFSYASFFSLLITSILHAKIQLPAIQALSHYSEAILFSQKALYVHDKENYWVAPIKSSCCRRFVIFTLVLGIEVFVTVVVSYVGVGFLLSSDDVEDLLMNSVSVAFIINITDLAHDSLQNDEVSEHIDKIQFQGATVRISDEDKDMSVQGKIREPSHKTYRSFWCIELSLFVIVLAAACTYGSLYFFQCGVSDDTAKIIN